jgi:hypothetical protein
MAYIVPPALIVDDAEETMRARATTDGAAMAFWGVFR